MWRLDVLYELTDRLHRAESLADVHEAALDAICRALDCKRASILLHDAAGVMRFVAWRDLSDSYRNAVDGHSPWTPDVVDPLPIMIENVLLSDLDDSLKATVQRERIGAMAFIPLVAKGRLVGKFMVYYDAPHSFTEDEIELALTIARQLGFSVQRHLADEALKDSEERFRRFMQHLPGLAWIKDVEGRYVYANEEAERIFRAGRDTLFGLADADLFPPEIASQYRQNDLRALAEGKGIHAVETLQHEDGVLHHSLVSKFPMPGPDGEPLQIGGMAIDITDRQRAEDALRQSEERLQLSLEAGRMGAWEWSIASGQVTWSPGLERIHGLEEGAFGGSFADFKRDVHPDDAEGLALKIQRTLETGADYHVEYRIQRPDGAVRWIEAFGRLSIAQGAVQPKLAGVCMDITERKQAEMQRDLMVAELSHRVNNTLATVLSIYRQSFSGSRTPQDASEVFTARIRALAQTHSRLAEASWSGIALETVVLDQLAPYRARGDHTLRVSGPPVALRPKGALTLGMALHELATNAAKYGALSANGGAIEVVWQLRPDGQLLIHWTEGGGPPVVPPQSSGFGQLLLERALVAELNGDVNLNFTRSGLVCAISVPLREAAA